MFNLLSIQRKQQQGQLNFEDGKGSTKSGTANSHSHQKYISSQQRQIVSQGMNYKFDNQYGAQNTFQITSQGKSSQNIVRAAHSQSSHQLQRLSSAMKVQSMNMLIDADEEYDTFQMGSQQQDLIPVLNNAFPNFPNKFKKERIASSMMNQKYIKKLAPRPETGVKAYSTQQMQQKYMDMFNQPKNLLSQVISIEETQSQSKKFFTENRVKTASTRSQTMKEIESLADIKDFRQIMEENVQHKQQEGQKNNITFATIDRARTANELYRKTTLKKPIHIENQQLENITDQSDKQSISNLMELPARAETAYHPNQAKSSSSLSKEFSKNGNVIQHLKRHMQPKSQTNIESNHKIQSAISSSNLKQSMNNNFVNSNNNQVGGTTLQQQQKINVLKPLPKNYELNDDNQIKDNNKLFGVDKKVSVQTHLDSALKERLKIDLTKSNVNNPASSSLKSPQTFSNTPKSFKGIHPTPKQSKLSANNLNSNNNNASSVPTISNQQDHDLALIQKEETVFRLNLKSNTLTKGELNYIIKKRKLYQQDLMPHMDELQKEFDQDDKPQMSHNHKKITFSVLDQPTILNIDNMSKTKSLLNNSTELEIHQENIVEPEKFFFDHPNNIHDQLTDLGQELRDKFNKYNEEDKLDFERFKEKKEQFEFNFLNTNEEGVSQHELNLIIEEYKLPSSERDYDFLDGIAERLKFFKRFTKPTRLYLLKLANIIQYPTNQVIFNQGDEGNLMYVIIRGACHVRIKRVNPDGKEDHLVVATLYDGQQFGELALMSSKKPQNLVKSIKANELGQIRITQIKKELEKQPLFNTNINQGNEQEDGNKQQKTGQKLVKNKSEEDINRMLDEANKQASKRAATIETCEVTTLFTVSREYFKTILLGLIQKELDVKLKLLQTLSFFEYMDPVSLIPLANLVEVKKYKLGEILVREGQEPNNFYIVSSGRLKIIKEEVIVRSNFVMGREHKYSKKNLQFGNKDYTQVIPEGTHTRKNTLVDNTKRLSDSSIDSEEDDSDAPLKAANFEVIYSDDQNIAYQYQHEFGSLVRGDFFFGRSILMEYLKVDPAALEEYSIDPMERAKLTVIADSAEIEVYILEKDKIHLIPNLLRRTMIDGLIARKEFDAVYTQEVSIWSKQWDKYKSNVLEQIKVERIYKKSLQ